jgi:hypothetical protein
LPKYQSLVSAIDPAKDEMHAPPTLLPSMASPACQRVAICAIAAPLHATTVSWSESDHPHRMMARSRMSLGFSCSKAEIETGDFQLLPAHCRLADHNQVELLPRGTCGR